MIDPAWASTAAIFVTSAGSWYWLLRRNGKANAKWQGTVDTKIEGIEKSCTLCQSNVKENFSHMRGQIEKVHDRITHSQGAE